MLNKKVKVLFRHRSMEMGGVEKVLLSMLQNLDKDKFEITLLLNLFQGELRGEIPSHIRLEYLTKGKEDFSKNTIIQKFQLLWRRKKLNRFLKNPKLIDETVLKEKYDIEVAMTYADFDSVLNSSNKNSKKIGWFHSNIHTKGLKPLLPKITQQLQQFDELIFCGKNIETILLQEFPHLDFPEIHVVTNPIPIDEILQKSEEFTPEKSDCPTFLGVGRLYHIKGFDKLISAHAQLISEGFLHKVVILGDGEDREKLLKQIKKLGVENTFRLLGNRQNPYPYIKNCDFFVLTSQAEAYPLSVAEALILKKPIIATNVGGVSEMITHLQNGYLIDFSTREIYLAMREFLTNPKLVSELQKNLKDSEKAFDNQKIFDKVEKILLNLSLKAAI
ncbi:MAG: glycosyltransferase [Cloacibacterium sp.]|nr:glycosyltransferase [Cloacibacterium sp.]